MHALYQHCPSSPLLLLLACPKTPNSLTVLLQLPLRSRAAALTLHALAGCAALAQAEAGKEGGEAAERSAVLAIKWVWCEDEIIAHERVWDEGEVLDYVLG